MKLQGDGTSRWLLADVILAILHLVWFALVFVASPSALPLVCLVPCWLGVLFHKKAAFWILLPTSLVFLTMAVLTFSDYLLRPRFMSLPLDLAVTLVYSAARLLTWPARTI